MKVNAGASGWPDGRLEVRTFGHELEVDTKGEDGPPPMALLLTSLAGCHVAILKHVLRLMKIGWDEIQLDVEAEETEVEPKVYTDIHLDYEIRGAGLESRKLLRAVNLAEKYCSVSVMLHDAGVHTTLDVRAIEALPTQT
ncbi:MAG: OsmC family protein [Thermoplasmata archaeon]